MQNSSGKIMTFIIQDLLDYSQIKVGNFRKNISEFNIKEAIDDVMSIQKDQAKAKNVDLTVNYVNILDSNDPLRDSYEGEIFSPILKSDVCRI